MIPTEDRIPLKDWYQYRHRKRDYMPRKRKTLEQHLTELIEEFGIVRVKAAIDMIDYFHRNGKSVTTNELWGNPVPPEQLPKGEPRIDVFKSKEVTVGVQTETK